jgi:hypothetical protein
MLKCGKQGKRCGIVGAALDGKRALARRSGRLGEREHHQMQRLQQVEQQQPTLPFRGGVGEQPR